MDQKHEEYEDVYYSSFHGFDKLEKEFRADGHYLGKASHFAKCKKDLIRRRPHSYLNTRVSDCFILGPTRTIGLLKDSAVVIHGPIGCAHNIYTVTAWFQMYNIFCTCLNENDIIRGTEEKLTKAIEEVIASCKPGMIGVITTCSTMIIGTDVSGICQTMERKTGIPIIPFPASGFRFRNWNLGADEALNILIDRMRPVPKEERIKNSINFFNFPNLVQNWREIFDLLPYFEELGIKINVHVPCHITFRELLEKFPKAELNVVRCPGTGYQSAEYAEKVLGIPYLTSPKPLGLKYTEKFIRGLGDFFHCQEKAEALIRRERERIEERLNKVRARLKGKKIVVSCCSGKSLAVAQMATELGMEVVYLGTYKTDSRYHDDLKEWIESSGQDPEAAAETGVYEEEAIFRRHNPDFIMSAIEGRYISDRLGVPNLDMIGNPSPQLVGFEGFIRYAELIVEILDNKFYKNWSKKVWGHIPPYSSKEYEECSPLALGSEIR